MVALRDVSATETAIVYGLEPVWGAAFAWFLLGERWDNAAWIGAALVLCKLVLPFLVLCLFHLQFISI
jgi:drug/metabolite transporter (DMT)-like permease